MSRSTILFCIAAAVVSAANGAPVATYTFNNTLTAQQAGVTALTAVDPAGTNAFQTATVFGNSQTTYHFDGAASPDDQQGGLTLDTTGLISQGTYSVEMVVELTGNSGWRRLMDSQDRQSDGGLYIDPNHNLDIFPDGAGTGGPFVPNSFFDVFVTVDADTVSGYLGGVQQFSVASAQLDIAANTLGFFIDNVAGGGQGEWSSGNIALLRVYDTALTAQQVLAETAFPSQTSATPEPGTLLLMASAAAGALFMRKRAA